MPPPKKAAKADSPEPKAPTAAAGAAPTASPPADPLVPTGEKWTAYEIVDGVTQPVETPVQTVPNLERAQALPELAKGVISTLVSEGIQSFKDTDRRTMLVVVVDGALFKQQAPERESA